MKKTKAVWHKRSPLSSRQEKNRERWPLTLAIMCPWYAKRTLKDRTQLFASAGAGFLCTKFALIGRPNCGVGWTRPQNLIWIYSRMGLLRNEVLAKYLGDVNANMKG